MTVTRFISLLFTMLLSFCIRAENYQFILSAGILDNNNLFDGFYSSRILSGEENPGFNIREAKERAFWYKDVLFYSEDQIEKEDILAIRKFQNSGHANAVLGHSYLGLKVKGEISPAIRRYLGAETLKAKLFVTEINNKKIFALSYKDINKIEQVKSPESLVRVPAVLLKDNAGNEILATARIMGSAQQKMATIKNHKQQNPSSIWMDLGTLGALDDSLNGDILSFMRQEEAVELAGLAQISALGKNKLVLNGIRHAYPIGSNEHISLAKNNKNINIWSVAGKEKFWPSFGELGKINSVSQTIEKMRGMQADPERSLNIVRAFSEEAAFLLAKSVYVDLVLLVSANPYIQLPSKESLSLKNSGGDIYEQIAPIVQVSSLDITSINIIGQNINRIENIEIIRHPLLEDFAGFNNWESKNDSKNLSLPDLRKTWEASDLNKLSAAMLMRNTMADAVIIENKFITPLEGPFSPELGQELLSRPGAAVIVETNGKQIKKIAALIKKNYFSIPLNLYGVDHAGRQIRERNLDEAEKVKLALSERALQEIFGISLAGGLNDEVSVRAPFLESVYGKVTNLLFLSGPKTITTTETAQALSEAMQNILVMNSYHSLIGQELTKGFSLQELKQYLEKPYGKARHSLSLKIDYLDLGFSYNAANYLYKEQKPGAFELPMSRGGADLNAHLLLFSKMSLVYDAPGLVTTLGNGVRLLSVDGFDKKPAKDKVTFNLDFRLPWERTLFKGKSIVLAPVWKTTYETKLFPLNFLSKNSEADWQKLRVLPRTNKLDSLLGFNADFKNLGFNFDFGGILFTDFTRAFIADAIDIGPGANFTGKWGLFGPLELSTFNTISYLFALPKNRADNKGAFALEGTVWLRVAKFHDFGLSLMSDYLFASLQNDPKKFAISSIFGVTFSYGTLFRIFG